MTATAAPYSGLAQLDTTQSTQIERGTIVLTGNYTAGGDTLNLTGPKFKTQSAKPPIRVFFTEQPTASVAPSGYLFYYEQGTTPANGKLRVMTSSTVEFTAGAYTSQLLAALIQYEAVFSLGI
jgi:hypothetical protein